LEFKTLYTALSSYEFVDRQMQNRQFIWYMYELWRKIERFIFV
jgi:hypothetical protein